jgi:hypothetical protein
MLISKLAAFSLVLTTAIVQSQSLRGKKINLHKGVLDRNTNVNRHLVTHDDGATDDFHYLPVVGGAQDDGNSNEGPLNPPDDGATDDFHYLPVVGGTHDDGNSNEGPLNPPDDGATDDFHLDGTPGPFNLLNPPYYPETDPTPSPSTDDNTNVGQDDDISDEPMYFAW